MVDIAGFEPGYWDSTQQLARDKLRLTWDYLVAFPGTIQMLAFVPDLPQPLGSVWYRFEGDDTIGVLNSYVYEPVRRCGIRSSMHRQMLAMYPTLRTIKTGHSTLDGRAWMKSRGYKKTPIGWEFTVNPVKKRR